jgi:hypothetical protein
LELLCSKIKHDFNKKFLHTGAHEKFSELLPSGLGKETMSSDGVIPRRQKSSIIKSFNFLGVDFKSSQYKELRCIELEVITMHTVQNLCTLHDSLDTVSSLSPTKT